MTTLAGWLKKQEITEIGQPHVLTFVLLVGLVVRLYGINSPLVDGLHIRQTQTAQVTRNLYENGMNILYPQLDIYGDEPGYTVLEFPLFNLLVGVQYFVFGVHEVLGRLTALVFSLGAIYLLFKLTAKYYDIRVALVAALVLALSPLSIYMGRAFMPESVILFFAIGMLYFFAEWLDRQSATTFVLAVGCAALAFLVKTTILFYLLPIGWMAWFRYGRRVFIRPGLYFYLVLTLTPIALWLIHMQRVNSLYNPSHQIDSLLIRFSGWPLLTSPAFYMTAAIWLVESLTPLGLLLFLLGLLLKVQERSEYVFFVWLLSMGTYFLVFGQQMSTHKYYWLPIVPMAAVFIGKAVAFLAETEVIAFLRARLNRAVIFGGIVGVLVVQLVTYAVFFTDSYSLTKRIPYHLEAGKALQQITPPNALIVIDDGQCWVTDLTYFAHRKGWGGGVPCWGSDQYPQQDSIRKLQEYRSRGASVYVAVNTPDAGAARSSLQANKLYDGSEFSRYLLETYPILERGDGFVILDLKSRMGAP